MTHSSTPPAAMAGPPLSSEMRATLYGLASITHFVDPGVLATQVSVSAQVVAAALLPAVEAQSGEDGSVRWVLRAAVRRKTLSRADSGLVRQWIEHAKGSDHTDTEQVLHAWLLGDLQLDTQPKRFQPAVQRVASWLMDCTWVFPPAQQVLRRLANLELRRQLEQTASETFVGRRAELLELSFAVNGPQRLALIEARGGMGKSALLARHFLEQGAFTPLGPLVVMLDFDDASITPLDFGSVLAELVRQAALQDPRLDSLESVVHEHVARERKMERSEHDGLVGSRLLSLFHSVVGQLQATGRSSSIVLDTLERARHVAPEALDQLVHLLRSTLAGYPSMSLVIAGRGPLELASLQGIEPLRLGPLPLPEASEMLDKLSVHPTLSEKLLSVVIPTPLTLRLAARVVQRLGMRELDREQLRTAVLRARVDGYLHSRVLAHLPSRRLARVAHLALPLLFVTPERLLTIVGPLLEPAIADAAEAEALFDEFRNVSDLVALPGGERRLVLRAEVREELLELAREADAALVLRVHAQAVAVLALQTSAEDAAECSYHSEALARERAAPFAAHVRKSNPRASSATSGGSLELHPGQRGSSIVDSMAGLMQVVTRLLAEPSPGPAHAELARVLANRETWSQLAAISKTLLRQAAVALYDADALRSVAQAAGFEWTGELDLRTLAEALQHFPELQRTVRSQGGQEDTLKALETIHQAGSLNSLAPLLLAESMEDARIVQALAQLLQQMITAVDAAPLPADALRRARLFGTLATHIGGAISSGDWMNVLQSVAPRIAERWHTPDKDTSAIHGALLEIDRRQLGMQLRTELSSRGLAQEAHLAQKLFSPGEDPDE